MINFKDYIKSMRAHGHLAFTTDEALSDLGISQNALRCGMYRLRKKGDIISPAKGLYVIVPPEQQALDCLPAEELIPILMKHWGFAYYVCLLSAAVYHGASHQKPQIFQVMTEKQLKPLLCGKVKIEFIYKKLLKDLPIQKQGVKTGYLSIATPELTAMDLLQYPHHAGGLNHIATVLSELIEAIDPKKLMSLITHSNEKAWIQRLGYLLEQIQSMDNQKQEKMITLIYQYISHQSINPVPLASELSTKGKPRNQKWMIIENTNIESDI